MSESRYAVKVGLFVAVGIILLALLLLAFSKGLSIFTPTYELNLKANSVGGLKNGASVLMSGVSIGNVVSSTVNADGKGVTIRLKINQGFQIHEDARFVIEQFGFLGDQYIAIYPQKNEKPVLPKGASAVCEEPFNLQEVVRSTTGLIASVNQTVKILNDAMTRLDRTVFSDQTLLNLSNTIGNFRAVSENALTLVDKADRLIETNSRPFSVAVTNLVHFSEGLDKMADEMNLAVITNRTELTKAVKNLENTTRAIDGLVKDLEGGKGLAGALLKDEQLKTNLLQMAGRLNNLASNLDAHGIFYKPKPPKKQDVTPPAYPGRNPLK